LCNVCGGDSTSCVVCDGEVDACGICNGNNETCGGCDGFGGIEDVCGVCAGDNSTCTCVYYHGYKVDHMDYILLEWTLNNTLSTIEKALMLIDESLTNLQHYPVDGALDLGGVAKYLNEFNDECVVPFCDQASDLQEQVAANVGEFYEGKPYPYLDGDDGGYTWGNP
jgi:hypothetical protein